MQKIIRKEKVMKCNDLKIGQKVFFISADRNTPAEEVFITDLNDNKNLSIKRSDRIVSFELVKDDSEFIFAISDEEKNYKEDYGFLYLNLDLIQQEDKFYDILTVNNNKIDNFKIEDKLKLMDFLEDLLKKY